MKSKAFVSIIILLVLFTSSCTSLSDDYPVTTEVSSEVTQSLVSEPGINFHRESDMFIIDLHITPPENDVEGWSVDWDIESLNPVENVQVVFSILPKGVCNIEVTAVEGIVDNVRWVGDSINSEMDFPLNGSTRISYKLSQCKRTGEGRFASVKVELMYGVEQFVFDEADLFWSQGHGSVVYSITPFPTEMPGSLSPVLTPWSFYEITPEELMLTPGVTHFPPTQINTIEPPTQTKTSTIISVRKTPTQPIPYP